MISPKQFLDYLVSQEVTFFTGVPDSLLKEFCEYIDVSLPPTSHVISVNEGTALGLATGYHLTTGNIPLIYMQNSGLGNAVNPLISLLDQKVYQIPALLLIGWRGEPGVSDEPQHITMGEVTTPLLDAMGIPYTVLSADEEVAKQELISAVASVRARGTPHALVVRKGLFKSEKTEKASNGVYSLTREEAIASVINMLEEDAVVVSTTGKMSRELFEIRKASEMGHKRDFLTIGSMGHASQIALGIAMNNSKRKVYCFDGDGAALMHLGGMATIGQIQPKNLTHIVFNNGSHESVGGQKTAGFFVDFCMIARSCQYKNTLYADTKETVKEALSQVKEKEGPSFVEIRTRKGSRENLGRPTVSPKDNKIDFMNYLRNKNK